MDPFVLLSALVYAEFLNRLGVKNITVYDIPREQLQLIPS